MVYYSTIHSYLSYCISSWGSASNTMLQPLDKLQKRAIRIITHSNIWTHTKSLFSKLEILKLHDMYELEIAKLMHRMMNNKLIICSSNQVTYRLLEKSLSYNTMKKKKKRLFHTTYGNITSSKMPNLYWAKNLE